MAAGASLGASPAAVLNTSTALSTSFYRSFIHNSSSWDPATFTHADVQLADALDPGAANADDVLSLSAFAERGGKVLLYHGEADADIPVGNSLFLHERMRETCGDDDFFRMFLVPGMRHCAGSEAAPWYVGAAGHAISLGVTEPVGELRDAEHDVVVAMMGWVEDGDAPERLVASKFGNDSAVEGIEGQRPLCVYPRRARFVGGEEGDPADVGSWECEV